MAVGSGVSMVMNWAGSASRLVNIPRVSLFRSLFHSISRAYTQRHTRIQPPHWLVAHDVISPVIGCEAAEEEERCLGCEREGGRGREMENAGSSIAVLLPKP